MSVASQGRAGSAAFAKPERCRRTAFGRARSPGAPIASRSQTDASEKRPDRGISLARIPAMNLIPPSSSANSVHFVVRADGFQQNGLRAGVFDKLKNDPQIVAGRAGPRTGHLALQLVCAKTGMVRVFRQQLQCHAQISRQRRILPGQPFGGAEKRLARQEETFQAPSLFRMAAGVAGRQRPALYSARASRTAWASSARRWSASRRRRMSTSVSCSSTDNAVADSKMLPNVFTATNYSRREFDSSPMSPLPA